MVSVATSGGPLKVEAEAAGFDERRLERITEHLQHRYIDAGKISGAQVAVVRRGALAYWRNFGLADVERATPVADDTIWRLFSMTKAVTGVALMTLYERAMFKLDDPVSRFIPSWKGLQVSEKLPDGTIRVVDAVREPTVKDVLMHTAGVGGGIRTGAPGENPLAALVSGDTFDRNTLESLSDALAQRPLRHQPGTTWVYGFQTDVCARLVEVISGQRFDDYLRDAVFGPLGMSDTTFRLDDGQGDRLAALYTRGANKALKLLEDPSRSGYLRERMLLSGGGGLAGTTGDYTRFVAMLAAGGELDGVRILSRPTIELMATNHLPGGASLREHAIPGGYGETGFDGMGFGLTFAIDLGPAATGAVGNAGTFSWGGAASTAFWVDPAAELAVVFMTQLIPSGTFDFRGQLRQIIYGAITD